MGTEASPERRAPRAQARSRRTHDRLLHAAAVEFARVGYENASIARASKKAGMTTGAMYDHFTSKWAVAEELLQEQQDRVLTVYENVAESLPSAFERLLCFSADLSKLIAQDPAVRASLQMSTEPALPMEAPVWRAWADLADELVATAPDGVGELRVTQRLGSLTVILLVSAWFLTRDQEQSPIDEVLQPMWSALAAGVVRPEHGASALASVVALFGK